jgi:hypothetical protein
LGFLATICLLVLLALVHFVGKIEIKINQLFRLLVRQAGPSKQEEKSANETWKNARVALISRTMRDDKSLAVYVCPCICNAYNGATKKKYHRSIQRKKLYLRMSNVFILYKQQYSSDL